MSLEKKQRIEDMHDSLLIKSADGIPEGVPPILPGQMSLDNILAIREETRLDSLIASQLPNGSHAFKSFPTDEGKRFELKRFVLARLMGISSRSKGVRNTFDFTSRRGMQKGSKLPEVLDSRMNEHITDVCKARIEAVRLRIAREIGVLQLSPRNKELMNLISNRLHALGLQTTPPLTHEDILNLDNLPLHSGGDLVGRKRPVVDIHEVLRVFYFCLDIGDFNWSQVAQHMKMDKNYPKSVYVRFLSKRAKEVLRRARNYTKLEGKEVRRNTTPRT